MIFFCWHFRVGHIDRLDYTNPCKNMKKKISVIKQIDAEDEWDLLVENLFSFNRELISVMIQ